MKMPHPYDIGDIPLHRNAPFAILDVSQSQMSPCRYYGAMSFKGSRYVYDPTTDIMWRDDVVKWWREKQVVKAEAKKVTGAQQGDLGLSPLSSPSEEIKTQWLATLEAGKGIQA